MKITPAAGPLPVTPTVSDSAAKARAVAAYNSATQAPPPPKLEAVPPIDPNNISPENSGIVRQKTISEATAEADTSTEAVESVEETQTEEEKPKADLSEQHQKLLRREKALLAQKRQQDMAFKAREEALVKREQELSAKGQGPDMSKYIDRSQLEADPLGTLIEMGYSADQIGNLLMQQQTPQDPRMTAEIRRLNAQIEKLSKASEDTQKSYEESQTRQYQEAVKNIENGVKKLAFGSDTYELVKATNSVKDVVELIEKTWKEDNILLTNEEALQQVEDYLVEEAERLAKLKKIQSRLAPKVAQPVAKPAQEQSPAPTKQPQQMKTLTNAAASSRTLSAKERAILAFKGELK